ncbi:hypothetical protein MAE02_13490 [Microvirga aerophila]|uniref:Uncharacterized protein n=1 Tax=Microvirga aerophila TaxID=670291 RepID=A0A512BNX6_9HYPH|nr:hypothetical protein MAE02_13490 [Microvirga aerophila]
MAGRFIAQAAKADRGCSGEQGREALTSVTARTGTNAWPGYDIRSKARFPTACLVGAASEHLLIPGIERVSRTSSIWIMSEAYPCARTLSCSQRPGGPQGAVYGDQALGVVREAP